MSKEFNPFSFFWPFSGDVDQHILSPWFSPTITTNNFAGDAAIEERVVKEVASYGSQIGCLNDIVLALAKDASPKQKDIDQLEKVVKEVDAIKKKQEQSRLEKAKNALDQLKEKEPEAYKRLIRERAGMA